MSSQTMRVIAFLIIGIAVGAIGIYAALSPSLAQVDPLKSQVTQLQQQVTQLTTPKQYKIGVSLPLTGELGDVGVQWRTVVEMAVSDLNTEMQKYKILANFSTVIQDDKTSSTEVLTVVQTFSQAGIKVIVGPAASSQVKAIKSYVDDNKIVVLSPSSTSPTLAIPNDYIFRTVGSDAMQSKALAALVKSKGVSKVVVFYRDDEYGVAFADFFNTEFSALGGTSVLVKYASGQADYASEVAQLSSRAQQESAGGIVIITFDTDGVNILGHAKDDSFLSTLKWFSSEGVQGATGLLTADVAAFIQKTSFLGTRPLFKENQLLKSFSDRYKQKTGKNPPVFSANLYDAIFLGGWSIIKAESLTGAAIRSVLPGIAEKYYGASGLGVFDTNGDKLFQDYSIWTVQKPQTAYEYVDVGSYAGGTIVWG